MIHSKSLVIKIRFKEKIILFVLRLHQTVKLHSVNAFRDGRDFDPISKHRFLVSFESVKTEGIGP